MPEETLPKNFGLVKEQPFVGKDYFAGVVDKQVLMPSGQWGDYLTVVEYQKSYETGFDSASCVTFSALNCIETLYKFGGENVNLSDNYTAVDSKTKPGVGNSLRNVAESIREGVVWENDYPFKKTQKEYYALIPTEVRSKAFKIPVAWEWGHGGENLVQWHKDRQGVLMNLLRYAPVQVTIYAYSKSIINDIYQPHSVVDENHAVMLFGYKEGECWLIYDHYLKSIKKLHWNYMISTPMLWTLDGKVKLAKKYAGKLIKNLDNPKVFYSNGKQVAWIKDEPSFYFGRDAGFWGSFEDVNTVRETIKEDIIF